MLVKQETKVEEEVEWLCTNNLHPGPAMQFNKLCMLLATQGTSTVTSTSETAGKARGAGDSIYTKYQMLSR